MKRNPVFYDDVAEVPTDRKMLRKLEKVTELKILDLTGKHVMTFWKGEKAAGRLKG